MLVRRVVATAALTAVRQATRSMSARPITDYGRFITQVSARREPSAIRAIQPLTLLPGMISLGGGYPNTATFPFDSLSVTIRGGSVIELRGSELERALQYTNTEGYKTLLPFLEALQQRVHNPPPVKVGRSFCVTSGSQEGLSKSFDMLIERDDYVLVENPTYSGALAALKPLTNNLVGITTDQYGMVPSALEAALKSRPPGTFKVMYIIPTGQNPSGATMTTERRRALYELASQHNLIILEDDPYWNLRFTDEPLPSFLSLDVDGRVLRFDSFSKILSSGLRLGWVTGPAPLMERLHLHMQSSVLHASAMSQAIVGALFNKWGMEGFEEHVLNVRRFYKGRRDYFVELADRHLRGLAEWHSPSAGFFLWMKLLVTDDAQALIQGEARAEKVLLVPGQAFEPNNKPSPYARAAFSTASMADMEEAVKRLGTLLKKHRRAGTA